MTKNSSKNILKVEAVKYFPCENIVFLWHVHLNCRLSSTIIFVIYVLLGAIVVYSGVTLVVVMMSKVLRNVKNVER